MPSRKVIKRRLTSVTTTKKIMRALDMVSASKLQNCVSRLEFVRAYFSETENIINNVSLCDELMDNIYINPPKTNTAAYLVITGDRGMCGSYYTNLLDKVTKHMKDSGKDIRILTAGSKGYEYFIRNHEEVIYRFDDMLETLFYEDAVRISHQLRNLFLTGEFDEVIIAYTEFESVFIQTPRIRRIMPMGIITNTQPEIRPMKYDMGISSFLDHAIPSYLNMFIYTVMLESIASENAARMVSMDSAVKNATDIIDNLTRTYNRKRQTAITQEISEIISGWQ